MMNFSELINLALYLLSGSCFGVFASRYSIFAALHIKTKYKEEGLACLFSCLPQLLFLFCTFFLFPTWFTSKTTAGGLIYYVILLFFFNKGLRAGKNTK